MDSLEDLLHKYSPKEPNEVLAIKRYIDETFHAPSSIGLKGESIVITVQSAALANTLRFHTAQLQAAAKTEKRIIFRIG